MKYINAAEVLPKTLLIEIQKHINGEILYIPYSNRHKGWGEKNGSKEYYKVRNKRIQELYHDIHSIEKISQEYGLAYETVRKIIYKKQKES